MLCGYYSGKVLATDARYHGCIYTGLVMTAMDGSEPDTATVDGPGLAMAAFSSLLQADHFWQWGTKYGSHNCSGETYYDSHNWSGIIYGCQNWSPWTSYG